MKTLNTILFLCGLVLIAGPGAGHLVRAFTPVIQSNLIQGPRIEARPTNCETHIAILDIAEQNAGRNELIIMIGRLGDGERPELNRRRLHSARAYLTEYHALRSPGTVIIGEGERVAGYGRIELYIGGKLHTAFALRRNAELSVGSCEPPELDDARQRELRKKLYPWRYRITPSGVRYGQEVQSNRRILSRFQMSGVGWFH
jgi:hypothetical protein